MKCQFCSNPATVHLTDIVNKKKKEVHLCQACAEQKQLVNKQELNLSVILQTLIGQQVGQPSDELARLTCPQCGIKFMEFRADGRLGCPHDYEVFRVGLEPLLLRIHRSTRHIGKVPRHSPVNAQALAELVQLRTQLRDAVEAEAYEEAARLRDLIRQKETTG
ncbi:MAG: UvrB/UvrC motif-containing protein [Gemmataceae bacterium]|nr:UvrB/UvrC motif-containing protein [Gemmataceae bacterium]